MNPVPIPTAMQLRQTLALCIGLFALLVPYIARALAIPLRGENWFLDYVPSFLAAVVGAAANLVHAATIYWLTMSETTSRVAVGAAVAGSLIYVLVVHFAKLDLRASSTAGVAVLLVPVYASGIALLIWLMVGALLKRRDAV